RLRRLVALRVAFLERLREAVDAGAATEQVAGGVERRLRGGDVALRERRFALFEQFAPDRVEAASRRVVVGVLRARGEEQFARAVALVAGEAARLERALRARKRVVEFRA